MVWQGTVIQIPEMGQCFQVDFKKSQLLKKFSLVRYLDDDGASSGQVTKLAADAKGQVFQGHGSGEVAFQAEEFIDVVVGPAIFGGGSSDPPYMANTPSSRKFFCCSVPLTTMRPPRTIWLNVPLTQKYRYSTHRLLDNGWYTRRRRSFSWLLDRN
ncbi:hypothetical protein TNCV_443151 [Trichonephila clavipes]|nr:hypothetical protein TNCV_443151 [Trichonephila clavipes]